MMATSNTSTAFDQLRPLSPLPRAYSLHLDYMRAHPYNRPGYNGAGSRTKIGSFFSGSPLKRESELVAIQRQSGWDPSDSPAIALPPPSRDPYAAASAGPQAPVLTGNAWHWGGGRCPSACRANGGVCLPAVGRCDCPRHKWGASCELFVQPAVQRTEAHHGWCVYNDSSPFFCDRPLCDKRAGETHDGGRAGRAACIGSPLSKCRERCNGKGTCHPNGRCACIPGYSGPTCGTAIKWHCVSNCLGRGTCEMGFCQCRPPYYGVDCSLQSLPSGAPRSEGHLGIGAAGGEQCTKPCVYVYELPARMNVLALKAEPHWPFYEHGPADYRGFKAVHIALLRSKHRTTDPASADLFYVPTWDLHGSWGNPELYLRAQRYVATVFPFWNRSKGADHIWTNTRDAGGCSNPWGTIWEQTRHSILLTNWGGVTGLGGVPVERCFDATRDLVIPGVLKSKIVAKSPFLPYHRLISDRFGAARSATADMSNAIWSRRKTLIFFHGAICWQTYDKVRSLAELKRKCERSHGFLDHYSFGIRWEVYRRFHAEPGFHLRATDLIPPPPHVSLDTEMLRSIFCLCPSGTGWGMRVFHSVALGCVPVIIQRDEKNAYPPVLQAFEGLLLDWSTFTVRLEAADVPNLPSILRKIAANETALQEKRRALATEWTRLLWREALPDDIAKYLRGTPDAFDSLMQSLWLRTKHGLRGDGAGWRPEPSE